MKTTLGVVLQLLFIISLFKYKNAGAQYGEGVTMRLVDNGSVATILGKMTWHILPAHQGSPD